MTEGLPLTDISLAEIEAAGAGDGVCVGRPLRRRRAADRRRWTRPGLPGTELTDRARRQR